jgi:hypothetical protein
VNEKRLVERAGLGASQDLLANAGRTTEQLHDSVDAVTAALGVTPLASP